MKAYHAIGWIAVVAVSITITMVGLPGQEPPQKKAAGQAKKSAPFDAVQDVQEPRQPRATRPEQQKNQHDQADIFGEENAPPSSPALSQQVGKGKMDGFDFARDPLGSDRPKMT